MPSKLEGYFKRRQKEVQDRLYRERVRKARNTGAVDSRPPKSLQNKKYAENLKRRDKERRQFKIKMENLKLLDTIRKVTMRTSPPKPKKKQSLQDNPYYKMRLTRESKIQRENELLMRRLEQARAFVDSGSPGGGAGRRSPTSRGRRSPTSRRSARPKSASSLRSMRRKLASASRAGGAGRRHRIYDETIKIGAYLLRIAATEVRSSARHYMEIRAVDEKTPQVVYGDIVIPFSALERRYGPPDTSLASSNTSILSIQNRKQLVFKLLGYLDIRKDAKSGIRVVLREAFMNEVGSTGPPLVEWTKEESRSLIRAVQAHGLKWKAILNDPNFEFHSSRDIEALSKRWKMLHLLFKEHETQAKLKHKRSAGKGGRRARGRGGAARLDTKKAILDRSEARDNNLSFDLYSPEIKDSSKRFAFGAGAPARTQPTVTPLKKTPVRVPAASVPSVASAPSVTTGSSLGGTDVESAGVESKAAPAREAEAEETKAPVEGKKAKTALAGQLSRSGHISWSKHKPTPQSSLLSLPQLDVEDSPRVDGGGAVPSAQGGSSVAAGSSATGGAQSVGTGSLRGSGLGSEGDLSVSGLSDD